MNSDLRSFVSRYLTVVLGTLMVVTFCAFLSIPYSLGGQPGEDNQANTSAEAPTQYALDAHQDSAPANGGIAVRL